MKKRMMFLIVAALGICMLAGCNKKAQVEEEPAAEETEEYYEEDFEEGDYEEGDFEEEYYEEEPVEDYDEQEAAPAEEPAAAPAEEPAEEEAADSSQGAQGSADAVGTWLTDGYDEEANWAMSYKIELTADGKASCSGYRNKDTGTYESTGDNKVLITFDHCETDEAGEGYKVVDGFKYTVEMTTNGDDADIKINAPDVISNLEDGKVHRNNGSTASRSGGGGAAEVADGDYLTDETYKGEISADGSTIRINTALYHEDENWNKVLDYDKQEYEFATSDDCKCVVFTETKEENPVSERIDFINEFLQGNSGLPISFKISGGKVTEIGFSS